MNGLLRVKRSETREVEHNHLLKIWFFDGKDAKVFYSCAILTRNESNGDFYDFYVVLYDIVKIKTVAFATLPLRRQNVSFIVSDSSASNLNNTFLCDDECLQGRYGLLVLSTINIYPSNPAYISNISRVNLGSYPPPHKIERCACSMGPITTPMLCSKASKPGVLNIETHSDNMCKLQVIVTSVSLSLGSPCITCRDNFSREVDLSYSLTSNVIVNLRFISDVVALHSLVLNKRHSKLLVNCEQFCNEISFLFSHMTND
jgi:hypothetical protein